MKKFLAGMVTVLALTVAVSGCGKKGASKEAPKASAAVEVVKPENVAKQYFEALGKGDTETAKKLIFMGEIRNREGFNKVLDENFAELKAVVDKHGGLESVTVDPAKTRYYRVNPQDPKRPIGSFSFLGPTGVGRVNPPNPKRPIEIPASEVKVGCLANVVVLLKMRHEPEAGGDNVQLVNTGNDWAIVIRGSEAFATR